MIKVGLVIPWFGKELKGGAEQLAWQIASRLTKRDEIDLNVLTTCSKSFLDNWFEDFYQEGEYFESSIKIKRFSVNQKLPLRFGFINEKIVNAKDILKYSAISLEEEKVFIEENINSDHLDNYIKEYYDRYDIFIFLPYLYGPILKNISKVKDKAILQPCLHNEGYAYMQSMYALFHDAKRVFYNSIGEKEDAVSIYGPGILDKSTVIGTGIEVLEKSFKTQEKQNPLVDGSYLFYIGRRDATKNTNFLIESFIAYYEKFDTDLKLVLAGIGEMPKKYLNVPFIIDKGLVSEEEKYNLISHSYAMINPSANESFSRIIYESWQGLKPVIVNRKCKSTYLALKEANDAGWSFNNENELLEIFKKVESLSQDELKQRAQSGYLYTKKITDWDQIIQRYIEEFKTIKQENKVDKASKEITVHQLSAGFADGDAISDQILHIQKIAKESGYQGMIYSEHVSDIVRKQFDIRDIETFKAERQDIVIYHHSIGTKATKYIKNISVYKKYMIYHNITPYQFFLPYSKEIVKLLKEGREELYHLHNDFDISFCDSSYNESELKELEFTNTKRLPLIVDPKKWKVIPDQSFLKQFTDGKKNILFVGRISPNKCQHDLIKLFEHYIEVYEDARLILAGGYDIHSLYYQELLKLIEQSEFGDDIILTGHISQEELLSCYLSSDLYISMSEHEGFGVPLIESMWFDIPVISYKSSAIPETLGYAGLMFDDKKELSMLSALVRVLLTDYEVREKVVAVQRERREDFIRLESLYQKKLFGEDYA